MDQPPTRDEALAILRAHRAELEARGIRHAALFGSLARGEADERSDIDVLIDFEPNLKFSVYDYAGHKNFIAAFFRAPVDVVAKRFLKPEVRSSIEGDAVYAF